MFVACGLWCLADVSSISPSLEQTEGLWGNKFVFFMFCHWLKLVASDRSKICLKLSACKLFIDSIGSQGPEFQN